MMKSIKSRFCHSVQQGRASRSVAYFGLAALLAMSGSMASAQIASGTTGIDDTGNAKSEMAACTSGKSQQARATCITEVRNANAAKRAGKLGTNGDYAANALKRCEVFKEASDQDACKARVMNEKSGSGSVASGGVLFEAVVPVPAQ